MENRELLQGQKLLGWVLILTGLAILVMIGLAESLERHGSLPVLGTTAAWMTKAQGNQTMVGVVAWFLLAGGYIFVLSARVEERLRDIGGELEERICHLQRELAALEQRIGDRSGAGDPAGNQPAHQEAPPGVESPPLAGDKTVRAVTGVGTASPEQ